MKIEYSKFDFNLVDIIGIIVFNVPYLIYKFFVMLFLKEKTDIVFANSKIIIQGFAINKEIFYDDIDSIMIQKNFLNSYDILINSNETVAHFRYLCNYITDSYATGLNANNTFVISDVKNVDEVLNEIFEKMYFEKEKIESSRKEIAYSGIFNKKYKYSKIKSTKNQEMLRIEEKYNRIFMFRNFAENEKEIKLQKITLYLLYRLLHKTMPKKYKKKSSS